MLLSLLFKPEDLHEIPTLYFFKLERLFLNLSHSFGLGTNHWYLSFLKSFKEFLNILPNEPARICVDELFYLINYHYIY